MESAFTARKRTRLESRKRTKLKSIVPTAMAADSNYAASFGRRKRQNEGKKERWRPWQIKDQIHTIDRKSKRKIQTRIARSTRVFESS